MWGGGGGHGNNAPLTYPHCSWESLLGSLPVLSAHSFASNWQLIFLKLFHDQTPRKNVVGREDQTSNCLHTRQTRIWPSYHTQQVVHCNMIYMALNYEKAAPGKIITTLNYLLPLYNSLQMANQLHCRKEIV